jgi:hypothetical protein
MRRISLLLALSAVLSAGVAQADEGGNAFRAPGHLLDASDQQRAQELSFFIGVPYGYFGYGFATTVGARYYIPILKNGFIPALNDEFGIEFGADFGAHFWSYFYPSFDIPVEVLWRFHFTERFDAYAKVGVGLGFNISYPGTGGLYFYPYLVSAVGLFFKLNEAISLRAEVGYPGIKVGIAFAF